MNTQTIESVQFTQIHSEPVRKFKVKQSLKSIQTLTEAGAIALVQKYNQAEDWEDQEAFEYAVSLYLAALAGSISHDEEMENLIEDCNLRMLNGISGCICGNHRDYFPEDISHE